MASRVQRELAFLLTGRDVSASRSLNKVDRAILRVNSHAGKAASNIGRNLETGVVLGAAAAAGAIGYAVKAAMDWQSAVAGVAKTVDGDIGAITDGIELMASRMPIAATELAAIAEAGGALGVAKGDILDFTEVVALLSVTTDLTSESAATSLGHLRTTLGLTGQAFGELGDELVFLGNHGASTESQILAMAENIAGAADVMDASKEQVLGWAAALANTGEEAEAGGSSIQRFWLGTFKAVSGGGPKLKLLAKTAGMTEAAFKKAFGKDATGTLAKFMGSLGKLSKAEQLATLDKLGFKDIRVQRALLKLLANTDNLTDSLTDAGRATGAMTTEADKRFATTASQVAILENNVKLAAVAVGEKLLPQINELAKEGVDWIQNHQPEIEAFANDLGDGIRDAVTWMRKVDWDGLITTIQAGAGFASGIVNAFLNAPPWVQQFLTAGFVANKFTGGVIGDVVGELGKGLIRGVLGMNAGVVNVRAGVVNGGGVGAGGAVGGAKGGGKLGAVAGAIGKVFLVGMAAGVATELWGVKEEQTARNVAQADDLGKQGKAFAGMASAAEIRDALAGIESYTKGLENSLTPEAWAYALNIDGVRTAVDQQKATLQAQLATLNKQAALDREYGAANKAGLAAVSGAETLTYRAIKEKEWKVEIAAETHAKLNALIGGKGGAFLRTGAEKGTTDANAGKLVELFSTSTSPSLKSMTANLAVLKGLAAKGDPATRKALSGDIRALQALIDARLEPPAATITALQAGFRSTAAAIREKDWSVTVPVTVNSTVTVRGVNVAQRTFASYARPGQAAKAS